MPNVAARGALSSRHGTAWPVGWVRASGHTDDNGRYGYHGAGRHPGAWAAHRGHYPRASEGLGLRAAISLVLASLPAGDGDQAGDADEVGEEDHERVRPQPQVLAGRPEEQPP